MKPFGEYKLESILQDIKGYVSHEIETGSIWDAGELRPDHS